MVMDVEWSLGAAPLKACEPVEPLCWLWVDNGCDKQRGSFLSPASTLIPPPTAFCLVLPSSLMAAVLTT